MGGRPHVVFLRNPTMQIDPADRFEAAGIRVTTVGAVPEALTVLRRERVSCVVTNCEVKRADGRRFMGWSELVDRIGSEFPGIPVVLYAEIDNRDLIEVAHRSDVFAYVPRDSRAPALDRLLEEVRAAIEHRPEIRRATRQAEINEAVREVNRVLVRSDSREGVKQRVCEVLAGCRRYEAAAFATVDGSVAISATGGDLATVGRTAPIRAAATSGQVVATDLDVAGHDSGADADHERLLAAPVRYGDDRYGVLVVYADRPDVFDADEQATLEELAHSVAHAIDAVRTHDRLRERTRELERERERLSELTRIISHEFRNPLQIAMGRVEVLAEQIESKSLESIRRSHDRLNFLIDDLTAITTVGERSYETEQVPVRDCVAAARDGVRSDELAVAVETDATVVAEPDRLRRIVENVIRLAVDRDADRVTVERRDDGLHLCHDGRTTGSPGDAFETDYAPGDEGTGIVLAAVDAIASSHGWSAEARTIDGQFHLCLTGLEFV